MLTSTAYRSRKPQRSAATLSERSLMIQGIRSARSDPCYGTVRSGQFVGCDVHRAGSTSSGSSALDPSPVESKNIMKKSKRNGAVSATDPDDILPEYDFSQGRPN